MTFTIITLAAAVAVLTLWMRSMSKKIARLDHLVSNAAAIASLHTLILGTHEDCLQKIIKEAEND